MDRFLSKIWYVWDFFLMSLFVLLFSKLLERGRTIDHYLLSFVLACFVLGGFTNQYLVSSASGVFIQFISSCHQYCAGQVRMA